MVGAGGGFGLVGRLGGLLELFLGIFWEGLGGMCIWVRCYGVLVFGGVFRATQRTTSSSWVLDSVFKLIYSCR